MNATRRSALCGVAAGAAGLLLPGRAAAQTGRMMAGQPDLAALARGTMNSALLQRIRRRLATPAMAVGWQRGPAAPALLVNGLRAAGQTDPVRAGDCWHIGSITKSFTATLFARAVEAGAISWDTKLGQLLPQVPPAYAELTAIELLSHHGGLPANIPMAAMLAMPGSEADPRASRLVYAAAALAQPPLAAPRTTFAYSNAGYVLAGAMLEAATGRSWEELLQREVLNPLGLSSAGFGPPGQADVVDQPRGHSGGRPLWIDNPAAMGPAGRLHMSGVDLLAWLTVHRDKPRGFLGPASWRELHLPRFGGNYALGWVVSADGSLWHNGSNTTWYAEATIDAASGLASIVCANDTALLNRPRSLLPAIRRGAGLPG